MSEHLQSVEGRWCERSIDDMERSALAYITEEVHNHFRDNGLVALLADYVRMGREYGDMMNTDARNMRERIAELENDVEYWRKKAKKYERIACENIVSLSIQLDDKQMALMWAERAGE